MRPPNLLFIFTDEQRADTMAAYGNARIQTPNLNRLASQSTVFERAYVTQPVCTPSRSSLLTGLYPHSNGCIENNVPLSAEVPCLPEMLDSGKGRQYATAYHGKWHLGDEVFVQHGFDEWRSIEDGYNPYYSAGRDPGARSTYYHWLVEQGVVPADAPPLSRGQATRLPERFGKPAYLAGEASRYIREHAGHPFMLFVNFLEPHMPFFGPRDGQHDPGEVLLPPNFDALPGADSPLKARLFQRTYYERGHSGLSLHTEADWRRMIANYWGLCSLVDTYVGAILDTLSACGLDEHTIVVYTSDHGDMMGSHRLLAKCVMYEEAVRVPLLVRLPPQLTNSPRLQTSPVRVHAPVSQIDVVPTLLDLMGQPIPDRLQGESLRPLLEGRDRSPTRDVFIEWNGHNNGFGDVIGSVSVPEPMLELASRDEIVAAITDPVRTVVTADSWKFNCSPLGEHELYHLDEDPYETRNLAAQPEMKPKIGELAERIRCWQEQTGDSAESPALATES